MKLVIKSSSLRYGVVAKELKHLLELSSFIKSYEMDIPDEAFDKLLPRQRLVLQRRYGEELTRLAIGKEFSITSVRVRQIEFKALRSLNQLMWE